MLQSIGLEEAGLTREVASSGLFLTMALSLEGCKALDADYLTRMEPRDRREAVIHAMGRRIRGKR